MMPFRVTGLPSQLFAHLFAIDDDALSNVGVRRYRVDAKPGYPDRIALRDLEIGETALLVNYTHQSAANPYRASHAIYVGENAATTFDRTNVVPEVLRSRVLSLRAFDSAHFMTDADLVDGGCVETLIDRFLKDPTVAYVQAHFAKRGCYAARIDRA